MNILTAKEVAQELGLNERTVRRMLYKGILKGFRIGERKGVWRIYRADLDKYLEGCNENL